MGSDVRELNGCQGILLGLLFALAFLAALALLAR